MGAKYDTILWKLRESDLTTVNVWSTMFNGAGDPNGVVTPNAAGDEYLNTTTWGKWFAKTTTNTSWVEINYTQDA